MMPFARHMIASVVVIVAGLAATNTHAYSVDGHETVGAIADNLLKQNNPKTYSKVLAALGQMDGHHINLQQASIWADCARSYYRDSSGKVQKKDNDRYESNDCETYFGGADGQASLAAYVANNWDNCDYAGKRRECHKSFHFADVPYQAGVYQEGGVGTNNHDIVHALNASIAVLQGKPSPEPFRLNTQQALYLLVHLVGDLHQPLHVGSVYLTPDGGVVANPRGIVEEDTHGGNAVAVGSSNLHHKWDETKFMKDIGGLALMTVEAQRMLASGQAASGVNTMANVGEPWASQTIQTAARSAFEGVQFSADDMDDQKGWRAVLGGRDYVRLMRDTQAQEVELAGARLALLLNTLFQ